MLDTEARTLAYLAKYPQNTIRQCAMALNLTERTVIPTVRALRRHRYLTVHRVGRRNEYTVNRDAVINLDGRQVPVGRFLNLMGIRKPKA